MTTKNRHHNNIVIEIPKERLLTCQECNKEFKSKAAIAGHIGAKHRLSVENYMIKHYCPEGRHKCPVCGSDTLFVKGIYSFKRFCPQHANEGRKLWAKQNGYGSIGGPNAGWKKGLTKETSESIRKQSEAITGEKNPWFGRKHPEDVIRRISDLRSDKMRLTEEQFKQKLIDVSVRFKVLTPYSEYRSIRQPLSVRCSKCDANETRSLWDLQTFAICNTCSPASFQELEVREMIRSYGVETINNSRSIISPLELDIYLAEYNFGIEFNGLYWHTEDRKGKKYHANKTNLCREKNLRLFHIFSDEWRENKEIVRSMILQRIGKAERKIHARKCKVIEVETKRRKDFFNKTHISGDTRSKKAFGLEYEGELVCCFSLRAPFTKKHKGSIEIARFASSLNTIVIGGFQKLLKRVIAWSNSQGYPNILTYADRRFGEGNVYLKAGFEFDGETPIDYWYTNGKTREGRFTYRAQNGKTEKEIAEINGVKKIFGCGSNRYILNL